MLKPQVNEEREMRKQKILWTLAAIFAVLGTILRSVPGIRFTGLLCWCAAVVWIAFAVLDGVGEKKWAKLCKRILLVLLTVGFAFFAAMEALVLRDNRTDAVDKDVTCVIILGAGVNGTEPSLMLTSRLCAALDFVADRPDVPIICSGGQGAGEDITEAECMARWLTEHGIAEERIWKEEQSTSTRENFDFSTQLMVEHGIDPTANFSFVTNDYHVARAKRIAGVPWAYGVAATLPRNPYYDALQINYYIREAFAMAELFVKGTVKAI